MSAILDTLMSIARNSGFVGLAQEPGYLAMIVVACILLYLAIVKEFEPLLLLPIAFGMLLGSGIIHMEYFLAPADAADPSIYPLFNEILHHGGLGDMLYMGVKLGIYPPLIFMGIGTMTDFAPLISNPKSLLLGAAAQLGIFTTWARSCWASPALRPLLSASSAAPMALPPSSSPAVWPLSCWAPSPWRRTATWHWFRSFSRPS